MLQKVYKILYIEDDIVDQLALKRFLKKSAFDNKLTIVESVQAGIEFHKSEQFDVVITDYQLADGNAFDVIKGITTVPVIFVTGMGDESIAVKAIKEGAFDYLIKDNDYNYLKFLPHTIEKAVISNRNRLKLKESEDRYEDLFLNSNDLIQSINTSGKFDYVNPRWLKTLGYTTEEALKMTFLDIIHDNHKAECVQLFEEIKKGGRFESLVVSFITKTGEEVIVEGSINCKIDNGVPIATQGIFRNITDKKQAAERLKDSEEQYRLLVESANDIIYKIDNKGNVVYMNKLGFKKTGYTGEEIIGFSFHRFIRPDYLNSVVEFYTQQIKEQLSNTYLELPIISKTGEETWVGQNVSIQVNNKDSSKIEGFLVIVRDISTRKKSEQRIRTQNLELEQRSTEIALKSKALEKSNTELSEAQEEIRTINEELMTINVNLEEIVAERTKKLLDAYNELDTFIYRASHDLKGPIARLIGLSQVAKMEISEQIAVDYFDRLEVNASKMKLVLDKLLMLHTINKFDVVDEELDLCALSNEFFRLNKNPEIEFEFIAPSELIIKSDRTRLKIILENIIQNSIDYSSLETKRDPKVTIELKETGNNVEISVTDNGIGIPEELIPSIFNMFYRGTEYSEGNGLGLYLVKKSVEKLNGSIKVDSKLNEYSKFTITIPKGLEKSNNKSPVAKFLS